MLLKKIILGLLTVVLLVIVLAGVAYFIFFDNKTQLAVKTSETTKPTSQLLTENNIKINSKKFAKIANQPAKRPTITAADHIWGKPEAAVKIIVYSDFTCPFCLQFYETTKKIKQEFGDQVAVVFRYFPLPSHQGAFTAALAAECAAEQNKFWPMYDKLFTDNKEQRLFADQYLADAKDLNLNVKQFSQCLESKKYKEKIARSYVEGKEFDILGTPTIFVNQEIYPGAYPFADFVGPDGQKRQGMKNIIIRHLKNSKNK